MEGMIRDRGLARRHTMRWCIPRVYQPEWTRRRRRGTSHHRLLHLASSRLLPDTHTVKDNQQPPDHLKQEQRACVSLACTSASTARQLSELRDARTTFAFDILLPATMSSHGDDGQPLWRPPPTLRTLHKSLSSSLTSSSQQALVPLGRVSSTLEDVKKNAGAIVAAAQTTLAPLADDLQLLKRVGEPRSGMRRVHSESNFARPAARLRLQRPPAAGFGPAEPSSPQAQPQQLSRDQQRQVDAWDWLNALNSTLNQARAAQQSRFQLSRAGLEEQVRRCPCYAASLQQPWRCHHAAGRGVVGITSQDWHPRSVGPRLLPAFCRLVPCSCMLETRPMHPQRYRLSTDALLVLPTPPVSCPQAKQLVHSASSMSLSDVKEQLLQKPKEALSNAAATLGTCQANLTSLSQSLQSSLAEGRSNLERHLSTLGEPGSPSSASSRLAALLSPPRLSGLAGSGAADSGSGGEEQQGGEGLPPWSLLPAPMRGREAAAIEALVTEDEQDGQQEEEGSGRGWGPFQVRLACSIDWVVGLHGMEVCSYAIAPTRWSASAQLRPLVNCCA